MRYLYCDFHILKDTKRWHFRTNKIAPALKKLIPILIILHLFLAPQIAANQHNDEQESFDRKIVTIPAGEVINQDYFAFGKSVEISGTVHGDVYAAGGQVLVDGTIDGDLLVAGGRVTISGSVLQDVRVAGGEITISGNIGRNITIAGGNVELTRNAVIQGGVVAGSGNVHLAGLVEQNAVIAAGNLIVSNAINGDLKAMGGVIRLTSHAQVGRDFIYWSGQEASIDNQAKIAGLVTRNQFPTEAIPSTEVLLASLIGLFLVFKLASFFSTLVLGLLILYFYPKFFQQGIAHLQQEPLKIVGLGFLFLFLTPLLAVLLSITVIGLPLAVVILAVFFVYLYLSRILVIAWAGHRLFVWFGKSQYEKLAFVGGLLLYSLVTVFPLIGPLLTFFTILFGLGTLMLIKKEFYISLRNNEII